MLLELHHAHISRLQFNSGYWRRNRIFRDWSLEEKLDSRRATESFWFPKIQYFYLGGLLFVSREPSLCSQEHFRFPGSLSCVLESSREHSVEGEDEGTIPKRTTLAILSSKSSRYSSRRTKGSQKDRGRFSEGARKEDESAGPAQKPERMTSVRGRRPDLRNNDLQRRTTTWGYVVATGGKNERKEGPRHHRTAAEE